MTRNKICCVFNLASHYRAPIYTLMDKELGCDFYLGDTMGNQIKLMNYQNLKGFKKLVKNRFLPMYGFIWQSSVWKLAFKPYKYYIVTGSPALLSTWLLAILARTLGKKVFSWSHGMKKPAKTKGQVFQKTFYKLFNKIFLYGNFSRDIMIKEGFEETKLIPIYNSLAHQEQLNVRESLRNTNIYKDKFKNENPVIIYIGRIQKSKKLDLLVLALKELLRQNVNCNLIFVGKDLGENNIADLVKKQEISQNVWFYGSCYNEKEIGNLLYNADVCVSPGPVGLTALHALTYGCPVISNDDFETQMPEHEAIHPGLNGDFYKNGDFQSLVNTIIKWIDLNPETKEKVQKAAYAVVDNKWNPQNQIKIIKKTLN